MSHKLVTLMLCAISVCVQIIERTSYWKLVSFIGKSHLYEVLLFLDTASRILLVKIDIFEVILMKPKLRKHLFLVKMIQASIVI